MAAVSSGIDPAQCVHYAAFASHLSRKEFDSIYWILFGMVILMLFSASYRYSRDHEATKDAEPGSHEYNSRMVRCLRWCAAYFVLAVVAIVMEVYALLALQFCDGEDLMALYWATWTMLQLGSLVAIAGIILAVYNNIRGNKNPPWALALGTPVLVVAGIGHAVHISMRKRIDRARSRSRSRRRTMSVSSGLSRLEGITTRDLPMSREDTLRQDDSDKEDGQFSAKLIGFTPEGAPILQFLDDPGVIQPERGTVIGNNEDGQVIVAFSKTMTTISANSFAEKLSPGSNLASPFLGGPSPGSSRSSSTLLVRPPPAVRIASPSPPRSPV